ncbi:MAG TPA: DUF1697 domain-containing protein [Rhizomicrobium sp.]|jgi:uncharacterized protein (DUF1697 family)
MTVFIALLRSVNVGGTAKFPMADLKSLCEDAGFTKVKTYIASGNVLFEAEHGEEKVKAILEKRVQAYVGRSIPVLVRTAAQMAAVAKTNPFPKTDPAHTVAIFLDEPPAKDTAATARGRTIEEIRLGKREIYVHYGKGMGNTKLKLRAAENGTARNINTIMKLAALAAAYAEKAS